MSCGALCPVGTLPGYDESPNALVDVRKRCGHHHPIPLRRSAVGGEIGAVLGRPRSRSPSHIIVQGPEPVEGSRPGYPMCSGDGNLGVVAPQSVLRRTSAGCSFVGTRFLQGGRAQGQLTDRWIHHRFQRVGVFIEVPRLLLPLHLQCSALPLSYPVVLVGSGSRTHVFGRETTDRAVAYRERNVAVPWGAQRPSSGPARPVFPRACLCGQDDLC